MISMMISNVDSDDRVYVYDAESDLSLQPSIGSNYEARRTVLASVAGAFT